MLICRKIKNAGRQKVKLATQLFSNALSAAITRMGTLGLCQSDNWDKCAKLLKQVNDWFDVFNSRHFANDSRERMKAYGLAIDVQNAILNEFKHLMNNIRVGKNNKILPFQHGVQVSISALPLLYNDLKTDYDINYLLTYRLNQDVLELFFGIRRSIGGLHDHPTHLEFKYRLRNFLLSRNETIVSQSANVDQIEEPEENVFLCLTSLPQTSCVPLTSTIFKDFPSTIETIEAEEHDLTELESDGLEHLAGFIAHTLKHENLGFQQEN